MVVLVRTKGLTLLAMRLKVFTLLASFAARLCGFRLVEVVPDAEV